MRIDFARLEEEQISSSSKINLPSSFTSKWSQFSAKGMQTSIAQVQEQSPKLTFSVTYPYEINRSVSPAHIKKQIAYLSANKELPQNTINFIKKQLDLQLRKQNSHKQSQYQIEQSAIQSQSKPLKVNNYFAKPQQSTNEDKNKFNISKSSQQTFETYLNSIKRKSPKVYHNVKSRVYDIKKKQVKKDRMKEQIDGVTLKPMLNYTMNCKVTKEVKKKRQRHFKACNIDVFQSLYYDASLNSTKRQLEKAMIQQQSKVIIRQSSKIQVNTTFEERLQTSIEKEAQRKKKAQNKIEYDISTGQKFYVPNTNRSKVTYQTLFKPKKNSITLPLQGSSFPARPAYYSKESQKFNLSQEYTTTLNNSFEKELNKSLDNKIKAKSKPYYRQIKLAQLYADLLWSNQKLKQSQLSEQQLKILSNFLQQVKKYENCYSKNVSKQVIIAFFKDTYKNMNLYDKAVLHLRLKKNKKEQLDLSQNLNRSKLCSTMRKKSRVTDFYHKSKQLYI